MAKAFSKLSRESKQILLWPYFKYHPPLVMFTFFWPPVSSALFFIIGCFIFYSPLNFCKYCWNYITVSALLFSVNYWLFFFQELGFCVHVKHPHKVKNYPASSDTTVVEVLFLFFLIHCCFVLFLLCLL